MQLSNQTTQFTNKLLIKKLKKYFCLKVFCNNKVKFAFFNKFLWTNIFHFTSSFLIEATHICSDQLALLSVDKKWELFLSLFFICRSSKAFSAAAKVNTKYFYFWPTFVQNTINKTEEKSFSLKLLNLALSFSSANFSLDFQNLCQKLHKYKDRTQKRALLVLQARSNLCFIFFYFTIKYPLLNSSRNLYRNRKSLRNRWLINKREDIANSGSSFLSLFRSRLLLLFSIGFCFLL